jgi:CRISPR-associated protein Cas1
MEIQQNTLYVMTQGAYLHRDHLALQVKVDGVIRLAVPLHNLQAVSLFGNVMVSPGAMELCAEGGVSMTFLSENGRLLARVDSPVSGNVLLRRKQFRQADDASVCIALSRNIVAGKVQNCRTNLLRAARDNAAGEDQESLRWAAEELASAVRRLEFTQTLDEIRGTEGNAARVYFGAFGSMIRADREHFTPKGRTRRPPLDRCNALLSFVYALLVTDCMAALVASGLDPNVGFLHSDRPGRPSLALDLMEEFRPMLADRLVLTLLNRRQLSILDFTVRDGGAVEMSEKARKLVVSAWQERKQETVTHNLLGCSVRVGMLAHAQARILARTIRGEMESYIPCTLK